MIGPLSVTFWAQNHFPTSKSGNVQHLVNLAAILNTYRAEKIHTCNSLQRADIQTASTITRSLYSVGVCSNSQQSIGRIL